MTIRRKLFFIIMSAIIICGSVSLIIFKSVEAVNKAIDEEELASEIASDITDIIILSEEYIINQESRITVQWAIKFKSLKNSINNLNLKSDKEKTITEFLKVNIFQLKELFDKLVLLTHSNIRDIEPRLKNAIIGRFLVESRITSSQSTKLIALKKQNVYILQKRTNYLLYIFVVILALKKEQ